MFELFSGLCRAYPQLTVFLAIAVGYFVGRIKIFGFTPGSTVGVLLAALVLGQMNIEVHELLREVAFALFIFAIGYKVGPSFFSALKKDGLSYIWVSLVLAVSGLITALALGKIFAFDPGTTAGLLAGAMTQSTIIGTADGAIKALPITDQAKTLMQSNVAVAYAITYIFGVAGLIIFYRLVPKIMGLDLKKEARTLEAKMGGSGEEERPEIFSWYKQVNLRAYKLTDRQMAGKTVKELEAVFPDKVALEKIKRGGELISYDPETVVRLGDELVLTGGYKGLCSAPELIGPEIDDQLLLGLEGEVLDVVVLNKAVVGKSLEELSKSIGHGCFLKRIRREEHDLPLIPGTMINNCDILTLAGSRDDLEKYIAYLGYVERPTAMTDLVMVGIGCFLGTLAGLLSITVLGIPVSLGIGGGILVAGLVSGWLRSVHPTFGMIPGGGQWILTDLGLNLFVACVGLSAGPLALQAIKTMGVTVFIAGAILTLVPHIVSIIFGRLVLKMDQLVLFGALTGAGTATPSLNALKDESESAVPALGFAVPYAIGNVILTVWGTIIVHVMALAR
ncbi:MAG: aspartate-alanine antiporter [Candidatus Margulisbacteria bacterium]|nr:aspartate-alanine antiporter [Candidatus Margulisiibacteriota bacterium]MBU1617528.1 aspartate-alanine antiporter [Candidatus Margulisiibacteriota bacterium]MBU1867153.1 aspartate-alanine antiporter [Candidatus Margulisiibacteriota bacterium]